MKLQFSIIIPVYNRPQEMEELLLSLVNQTYKVDFEVVVVEDGSSYSCKEIVDTFINTLNITYLFKKNTGAGQSRNYGMRHAMGNYFVILDSDVLLPKFYLKNVSDRLKKNYSDAFGGADSAHQSFTPLQKAINYSMTSVLTTGGIRGKKNSVGKFQPRSFNMGLSKVAFEKTGGFSEMKYGEDIDLTFRLWENEFETQFIETANVYHKRRSTLKQFYRQTFNFGNARPILNRKYPDSAKLIYWFPSLFAFAFNISLIAGLFFENWVFTTSFLVYFLFIFSDSLFQNKNLKVAFLSIITTCTQFFGYGFGFLKSTLKI